MQMRMRTGGTMLSPLRCSGRALCQHSNAAVQFNILRATHGHSLGSAFRCTCAHQPALLRNPSGGAVTTAAATGVTCAPGGSLQVYASS